MSAVQQQDPFAHLQGALGDETSINARLDWAERYCFLVSPSTTCALRPGCSVAFNAVRINAETEAHDVGGGKYSLSNTALRKLAGAAGIVFDPDRNFRVPPFDHPHLVHWHVVAAWRGLDGDVLSVPGDACFDLRDGSEGTRKILESVKATDREGKPLDPRVVAEKGRVQLRDVRAKLFERAQTGAELRAIRKALHIRTYTRAELQSKPFVIARLTYDGHDENPEFELENRRAIRSQMLAGARALFGGPPPPRELAAPAPMRALPARAYDDVMDAEIASDPILVEETGPSEAPHVPPTATAAPPPPAPNAQTTPVSPPAPPPTPRPAATAPKPAAPPPDAPARSGAVIPGGRNRGQPIEDADDRDLTFWAERLADGIAKGDKPQFRDSNQALLDAIRAEQNRRSGGELPPGWE